MTSTSRFICLIKFSLSLSVIIFVNACTGSDPALSQLDRFIQQSKIDKNIPQWKEHLPKPPLATFDPEKAYLWDVTTNKGNISIKLMTKTAPMHVSSTIYLTRLGFYDDVRFHRVIPGFMAQGGDPKGIGSGGPGYKYGGEFEQGVSHNKPGILSMANAGPNTDGSQFFITFKATPFLDGKHTVFGEVVDGMTTVRTFEQLGTRRGKPSEDLRIITATIRIEPEPS